MALLLGITRDTYTKYEGRGASLMPHNLIVPFCLACRVSVEWLLTGIGPTRSRWSPKMLSSSKMLIEKAWAPSQTMSIFDWR